MTTGPTGRSGRERWLIGVAAVSSVLALMFAVLWLGARGDDSDARAEEMRTTAEDFLLALTNFDAATVDDSFDAVAAFATGQFADQADTFFGSDIRTSLKEAQASSRGEVRDLYVQSFDGDRGRVFAVVDQTVANNLSPAPQADELRLEVALARVEGEWKVSEVKVLVAPSGGPTAPVG